MTPKAPHIVAPRIALPPVDRLLVGPLGRILERERCVVLRGLFEVGKTHLAKKVAGFDADGHFFDASNADHVAKLLGENGLIATGGGALIVIDEAHILPECMRAIRRELERAERRERPFGRYLLLGSSTQETASLAFSIFGAWIVPFDVGTITLSELSTGAPASPSATTEVSAEEDIQSHASSEAMTEDDLWLRGGLPFSLLANGEAQSYAYRGRYIENLAARCAAGWDVSAPVLREFLERMALAHGSRFCLTNKTKILTEMKPLVGHCIDLGIIRRLHPWSMNRAAQLEKESKYFFRDTGLLHVLRQMQTLNEVRADKQFHGESWEGFCIEALHQAAPGAALSFFREDETHEIDLVLYVNPEEPWAIEIKAGKAGPRPGFYYGVQAIGAKRKIVVRRTAEATLNGDVEIMPLRAAIEAVRSAAQR